jgi:hypothetical protein
MNIQLTAQDEQRARMRATLIVLCFGILFIPAFTLFTNSALRFVVYLLPGISIALWLFTSASQRFLTDMRALISLMLYACLPLIGAFMQWEVIDGKTWINAFRPILYLAIFLPLMLFNDRSVKMLAVIYVLASIMLWVTGAGTTRGELDLAESRGPLESGLAFPLGGMLLYFLLRHQWFWSFIVFILFFLAFKRIAFGAFGIIAGLMFLGYYFRLTWGVNRRAFAHFSLLAIAIMATAINVYYVEFFSMIANLLGTEQSLSRLTMGRLEEFQVLYQLFGDQPWRPLLFGNGPGDATRKLVEITITYPLQVHNSFLLYFYDFGVIGFMLLMLAFYVVYSRNAFGLYLYAYNIIIMITDNNFSHHYHQITYFILILAWQYEVEDKPKKEQTDG